MTTRTYRKFLSPTPFTAFARRGESTSSVRRSVRPMSFFFDDDGRQIAAVDVSEIVPLQPVQFVAVSHIETR